MDRMSSQGQKAEPLQMLAQQHIRLFLSLTDLYRSGARLAVGQRRPNWRLIHCPCFRDAREKEKDEERIEEPHDGVAVQRMTQRISGNGIRCVAAVVASSFDWSADSSAD
jgi:hypothetical protein